MTKYSESKLRRIGLYVLVPVLLLLGLMINQHNYYMDTRLEAVQDYQVAFHGDALHVLTFVRAVDGENFLEPLRNLVRAAHETEGTLIYGGQVIYMGLRSAQIDETFGGPVDWHAVLLQQFDSQAAYQEYLRRPEIMESLGQFELTYTHGLKRSAGLNLLFPQLFLAMRIWRQVTFASDVLPFEPSSTKNEALAAAMAEHADGLGRDAILIVNLTRNGTAEQQAANGDYGLAMLGLMADLRYGILHLGTSVTLEHGHEFDQAILVYYPGSRYFGDLNGSTWFQSIIGDKQLADTQAIITVPVTNLLTADLLATDR